MAEPGQNRSESQKSSAELEREIDRTRTEIDHTLGEIYHRLTPGDLFEHVISYLRDSQGFRRFGATVRDNPVPTVLTIVGIGWLIITGLRSNRAADNRFRAPTPGPDITGRRALIAANREDAAGRGARTYRSETEWPATEQTKPTTLAAESP